MAVYGYCRLSVDSGEAHVSIDHQRGAIQSYARANLRDQGKPIIFGDVGVSGGIRFALRPESGKLDKLLKDGDHLIVYRLDRLFRSVADGAATIHALMERGVQLHLMDIRVDTTTPAGRMIAHMIIAMAEMERGRIGERIRDSRETRRRLGLPYTCPLRAPLGWTITGKPPRYEVNTEERAMLKKIAADFKRFGSYSLALAASIRRGDTTRQGITFSYAGIRRAVAAVEEGFPLPTANAKERTSAGLRPGSPTVEAIKRRLKHYTKVTAETLAHSPDQRGPTIHPPRRRS